MATDRIEALTALLTDAGRAHSAYEATDLGGVYDQEWPAWYAAYAVEHGLGDVLGHDVTTDQVARFLATSNTAFEQSDPKPSEPWAAYTARRIAEDL